ncbi:MAG: ParB/RepB/Spo0J family partition protein [Deltaproteobacteria bacterium]|nr:ParB/RepB/Spo0J family partition protein [Deltaproteobacteria bacterium]MBL7205873.1 ParB/RepB/Spo0J family partition protein [Desulfobacteraceae bacterium]
MKESSGVQDAFLEVPVSEIDKNYARLRLIHPKADATIVESIRKYGQLSPVVVGRAKGDRYELVDGFKRFRACQQLGFKSLNVRVLDTGVRALKAAIICLNRKAGSVTDLEEAMVVHSLFREDGLTQVEIATLLGHHKSWVCRRISLIERLCDEALSHIRLGLVSTSIGRELARLPRGNQQAALSTILKYRLCCRETARLISMLLQRPRWDHEIILRFPEEILADRSPDRPKNTELSRAAALLHGKLIAIERRCLSISKEFSTDGLSQFTKEDQRQISSIVDRIEQILKRFKNELHQSIS